MLSHRNRNCGSTGHNLLHCVARGLLPTSMRPVSWIQLEIHEPRQTWEPPNLRREDQKKAHHHQIEKYARLRGPNNGFHGLGWYESMIRGDGSPVRLFGIDPGTRRTETICHGNEKRCVDVTHLGRIEIIVWFDGLVDQGRKALNVGKEKVK